MAESRKRQGRCICGALAFHLDVLYAIVQLRRWVHSRRVRRKPVTGTSFSWSSRVILVLFVCLSPRPSTFLYYGLRFLKCDVDEEVDHALNWKLHPQPQPLDRESSDWQQFEQSVTADVALVAEILGEDPDDAGNFQVVERGDRRLFVYIHSQTWSFTNIGRKKWVRKRPITREVTKVVEPESNPNIRQKLEPYYRKRPEWEKFWESKVGWSHRNLSNLDENLRTERLEFCLDQVYMATRYRFCRCISDGWCQVGEFSLDESNWFPFTGTPDMIVMEKRSLGAVIKYEEYTIECKEGEAHKADKADKAHGESQLCGQLLKLAAKQHLLQILHQERQSEKIKVCGLLLNRGSDCHVYEVEVSHELPKISCQEVIEGAKDEGNLLYTLNRLWPYKE